MPVLLMLMLALVNALIREFVATTIVQGQSAAARCPYRQLGLALRGLFRCRIWEEDVLPMACALEVFVLLALAKMDFCQTLLPVNATTNARMDIVCFMTLSERSRLDAVRLELMDGVVLHPSYEGH